MLTSFFDRHKDLGLLIIRLGVGVPIMAIHGYPKITGGPELWKKLGGAMSNLGISFAPAFWGFMSAFAEFVIPILVILGIFFRPAILILCFNMFVASLSHLSRLDPWGKISHPLTLTVVALGLFLAGPGKYSVDYLLSNRKKSPDAI